MNPTLRAEAHRELLVLQVVLGHRLAERLERARVGEDQTVQDLEQRRLPAAVGAEQRDALAVIDRERHAVERGEPLQVGVAHVAAHEVLCGASRASGSSVSRRRDGLAELLSVQRDGLPTG